MPFFFTLFPILVHSPLWDLLHSVRPPVHSSLPHPDSSAVFCQQAYGLYPGSIRHTFLMGYLLPPIKHVFDQHLSSFRLLPCCGGRACAFWAECFCKCRSLECSRQVLPPKRLTHVACLAQSWKTFAYLAEPQGTPSGQWPHSHMWIV